jgi:glutamate-ammonia-ligase adenylyltransferase
MIKKHGYPDSIETINAPFIVVGYGKLGGIELSHGSDLDLVFLHNSSINGETNGAKPIDNQTFFMRLGQKIIHMLNTRTAAGELYEIDMRLRPSGNSGLLTASLNAFEKYQLQDAWTWEHQALVRARVVAGSSELAEQFKRVRTNVLSRPRNLDTLQKDVAAMREKMRIQLGSDTHNDGTKPFHIKQDTGGIVDIEFMVQYAVLAWSQADPALLAYTDNIRILECLAQTSRLSTEEVDQLIEAYKAFRSAGHRLTLQQKPSVIAADELLNERHNVQSIWDTWFAHAKHPPQ